MKNVLSAILLLATVLLFPTTVAAQLKPQRDASSFYGYKESGAQEWAIQPIFESADDFDNTNGVARVKLNGKYGFINAAGAFVIQPVYDEAYGFSNRLTIVGKDKAYYAINLRGETISPTFQSLNSSSGIYYGLLPDGYAILNKVFQPISTQRYEQLRVVALPSLQPNVKDGPQYIIAKKNGRFGMINAAEEVLIPFEYAEAEEGGKMYFPLSYKKMDKLGITDRMLNHFVTLKRSDTDKWGVLSLTGEEMVPFAYPDGYTLYYKGGLKKYKGKTIIPAMTSRYASFAAQQQESLLKAEKTMREEGERLIAELPEKPAEVKAAEIGVKTLYGKKKKGQKKAPVIGVAFTEDGTQKGETYKEIIKMGAIYHITGKNGKKGLADAYANVTVDCQYDNIVHWNAERGILLVEKGGKYGLIDIMGRVKAAVSYDAIMPAGPNYSAGLKDGKYILLGADGSPVKRDYAYDDISFSDDKVMVSAAGYTTSLNSRGEESPSICSVAYDDLIDQHNKKIAPSILTERAKALLPFAHNDGERGSIYNFLGVCAIDNNDEATAIPYYQKAAGYGNQTAAANLKAIKQAHRAEQAQKWADALSTIGQTLQSVGSQGGGSSVRAGSGVTSGVSSSAYTSGSSTVSSGAARSSSASQPKACNICHGSGKCMSSGKGKCFGTGKCSYCNGDGFKYVAGEAVACSVCDRGRCRSCNGTGRCKYCNGTGKR